MNAVIDSLKGASTVSQAFGVTLGGLLGVFATLAFFFVLIWTAERIKR